MPCELDEEARTQQHYSFPYAFVLLPSGTGTAQDCAGLLLGVVLFFQLRGRTLGKNVGPTGRVFHGALVGQSFHIPIYIDGLELIARYQLSWC